MFVGRKWPADQGFDTMRWNLNTWSVKLNLTPLHMHSECTQIEKYTAKLESVTVLNGTSSKLYSVVLLSVSTNVLLSAQLNYSVRTNCCNTSGRWSNDSQRAHSHLPFLCSGNSFFSSCHSQVKISLQQMPLRAAVMSTWNSREHGDLAV